MRAPESWKLVIPRRLLRNTHRALWTQQGKLKKTEKNNACFLSEQRNATVVIYDAVGRKTHAISPAYFVEEKLFFLLLLVFGEKEEERTRIDPLNSSGSPF